MAVTLFPSLPPPLIFWAAFDTPELLLCGNLLVCLAIASRKAGTLFLFIQPTIFYFPYSRPWGYSGERVKTPGTSSLVSRERPASQETQHVS